MGSSSCLLHTSVYFMNSESEPTRENATFGSPAGRILTVVVCFQPWRAFLSHPAVPGPLLRDAGWLPACRRVQCPHILASACLLVDVRYCHLAVPIGSSLIIWGWTCFHVLLSTESLSCRLSHASCLFTFYFYLFQNRFLSMYNSPGCPGTCCFFFPFFLKKERFILAHAFRRFSPSGQGRCGETEQQVQFPRWLSPLFPRSLVQAHGMVWFCPDSGWVFSLPLFFLEMSKQICPWQCPHQPSQ